jgi:hypothetical protein
MNPQRLALVLRSRPLVETVSGNDTSALLEGLAERRPLLKHLGLGVDALTGAPVVLRPAIDETPAGALRFSPLEFRSDDEVLISRRDIEARPIAGRRIVFILDAECVGDLPPFVLRQGEPSTHSIKPR